MILGIIPSRYRSTRLPGKPLIDLGGKTMIERVYAQCEKAKKLGFLDEVVVATDDARIYAHVKEFGGNVVMTSETHQSGTDRCFEALQLWPDHEKYHYIINIQGDEPLIDPYQIGELSTELSSKEVELATQMMKVTDAAMLEDTGEVKIILNNKQEALYFSRSAIPFQVNKAIENWLTNTDYYHHVGMYAYRADILKEISNLPLSKLENAESLEQLRWVEAGYKIKCILTKYQSRCVDTKEDVEKIKKWISN